ncbi:MAG: hypothetical protein MUF86_16790 [Akkermansiaceae bacterium]|jgi:Cu/Ag efflux pump CusA|nr:hypothetical protein [Akkermansiaceae bacterium]
MSRIPWQQILSFTPADLVKLLLSAAVIVIVNKVQLFSDRLSALLIALPLTSLVAMIWMHQGGQSGPRCSPTAC